MCQVAGIIFYRAFQFHKGTIRTAQQQGQDDAQQHFNSIKVRLEQLIDTPLIRAILKFQFHKGTIRTCLNPFLKVFQSDFNSIKVRLERRKAVSSVSEPI